ncbi:hypothetical protein [Rossellomorea marisflavi]|uniref:hypothetical protein n=1 Tax=Rossellomorea marisflavi TaxID=189381 RepID=UPI003F9F7694
MVEDTSVSLTLGLTHCSKGLFGLFSNQRPTQEYKKKPNEFDRVEFVRLFY